MKNEQRGKLLEIHTYRYVTFMVTDYYRTRKNLSKYTEERCKCLFIERVASKIREKAFSNQFYLYSPKSQLHCLCGLFGVPLIIKAWVKRFTEKYCVGICFVSALKVDTLSGQSSPRKMSFPAFCWISMLYYYIFPLSASICRKSLYLRKGKFMCQSKCMYASVFIHSMFCCCSEFFFFCCPTPFLVHGIWQYIICFIKLDLAIALKWAKSTKCVLK